MTSNYQRGSEWRKWDLHIHAPTSALNNQFEGATLEEKWSKYLDALENLSDVAVLGITDYFSIAGYEKLKGERENGRVGNVEEILPNVELRILPVTANPTAINIHVIFAPCVVDQLESCFFQALSYELGGNSYRCTKEDLIRLGRAYRQDQHMDEVPAYISGVEQFKVTHQELAKVLRGSRDLQGKYLVILSNSSNDGNSGIQHSSLASTRQEIYRLSHMIFSSNVNDRDFFLGRGGISPEEVRAECGSLKPCIHGSDAHSLDKVCKPDLERYTWIKADPTFEGLRQLAFEPETRVHIGPDSPLGNHSKAHFKFLEINGPIFENDVPAFRQQNLPLNRDMVTIIGGRGTGKSLLLDVLFHTFHEPSGEIKNDFTSGGRIARIADPEFKVKVAKPDDSELDFSHTDHPNDFPYLHVRQGEVKEIAEDPEKLADAILELLGYVRYQMDPVIEKSFADQNLAIDALLAWLVTKDDEGNLVNHIEFNEKEKQKYERLKSAITTHETRERVEQFAKNTKALSALGMRSTDARLMASDLSNFETQTNKRIDNFNQQAPHDNNRITPISFKQQLGEIAEVENYIGIRSSDLRVKNLEVTSRLAEAGIKADVDGLLEKVDEYQKKIDGCNEVIARVQEHMRQIAGMRTERRKSARRIINHINIIRKDIERRYKKRSEGGPNLSIEHRALLNQLLKEINITAEVYFDSSLFLKGLEGLVDGRKFRTRKLSLVFEIHSAYDFIRLLHGSPLINVEGTSSLISLDTFAEQAGYLRGDETGPFFDYFYLEKHRREYLRVRPSILYKSKPPSKLSVGQRGTFYVCMKLATEAFTTPFIFDQPEDDLDNQFIVEELRPIFREIKKFRQVILVTHNANLVVNTDAEQVVVAQNIEEVIEFDAGSLENSSIRTRVCTILEGGKEAFLKRERLYEL